MAGYEDTNDAERLSLDPAMRHVAGGRDVERSAASTSVMSRFETEILIQPKNLEFLMNLAGEWIDRVHQRKSLKQIILDMDSSVSPTYGNQEGTAYNGYFLRRLALPKSVKQWSLRTLRDKLIKIGAKLVSHSRYVIFQMAEVAVPRILFREILDRIMQLRSLTIPMSPG